MRYRFGEVAHSACWPTMSRAMNDDEVLTELKKMVAFIRQEAVEKAHEIQVKADEEFAIEKVRGARAIGTDTQARIVHQEAAHIDASSDKKRRQAEQQQKMYAHARERPTNRQRAVEPQQQGSIAGAPDARREAAGGF